MIKRWYFYLAPVLMAAPLWGEEPSPPPREQGMWQTLLMVGVALLFFYLILWRPEQKRRRALEERRGRLKKGDTVTAMGIVGTVARVGDKTVILKMVDGNKIEFLRAAITDVVEAPEGAGEEGE